MTALLLSLAINKHGSYRHLTPENTVGLAPNSRAPNQSALLKPHEIYSLRSYHGSRLPGTKATPGCDASIEGYDSTHRDIVRVSAFSAHNNSAAAVKIVFVDNLGTFEPTTLLPFLQSC